MNWPLRKCEIHARFFGETPFEHLTIRYAPETNVLSWHFVFLDFGMCHSVSHQATVSCQDGVFCVNDQTQDSEDTALAAVFAGHFARLQAEVYEDMDFLNHQGVKERNI